MKSKNLAGNCLETGKVCKKLLSSYEELESVLEKLKELNYENISACYDYDDVEFVFEVQFHDLLCDKNKLFKKLIKVCSKCEGQNGLITKLMAEINVEVAKKVRMKAERELINAERELNIVRIIEENNEYLHKTYGKWVNSESTTDGFAVKVTLKGVDVVATLMKMDDDPNIPTNDNPIADRLIKLRDSLANGTFVPSATVETEE